jgi:hypothetical protein
MYVRTAQYGVKCHVTHTRTFTSTPHTHKGFFAGGETRLGIIHRPMGFLTYMRIYATLLSRKPTPLICALSQNVSPHFRPVWQRSVVVI